MTPLEQARELRRRAERALREVRGRFDVELGQALADLQEAERLEHQAEQALRGQKERRP